MIKLVNLLNIKEPDYFDYKLHFAIGRDNKKEPYNKFLVDEFKEWQECQTQKNWSRKYIISLIYYDKDLWLYGGVYEVLPIKPKPIDENKWKGWKYETKLLDVQRDLIGRVLFYYKKEFRASYPTLELKNTKGMMPSDIYVSSIFDKKVAITDFLGFDQVNIDHNTLRLIVKDNILSWKSALSNVKGIYLITDKITGKQYVGSAYGDNCIWQRWVEYAENGHGGNVELKELLQKNGENYKFNFKYSVLEICNMSLGNEYIINRENHWKDVLLTRKFGLNKN
jgi:hypothetical protein